jgi:hypothetical protein
MKKYVKIHMRNKKLSLVLPLEKAEQILRSPQQLVMVTEEDGSWNGLTINKAEIVFTDRDYDTEADERPKLAAPISQIPVDISRFKPEWMKN